MYQTSANPDVHIAGESKKTNNMIKGAVFSSFFVKKESKLTCLLLSRESIPRSIPEAINFILLSWESIPIDSVSGVINSVLDPIIPYNRKKSTDHPILRMLFYMHYLPVSLFIRLQIPQRRNPPASGGHFALLIQAFL